MTNKGQPSMGAGSFGGTPPAASNDPPLRVVLVDDQAAIRQALSDLLRGVRDVELVGQAADGDEGLSLVHAQNPDVILLDLEMPRLDGFTFLRLLMAKRPTPVIVVSSHSSRESVFRALELGAMDFVAKPTRIGGVGDLAPIREDLLQKLRSVRRLRLDKLAARARQPRQSQAGNQTGSFAAIRSLPTDDPLAGARQTTEGTYLPNKLLCIGASTGGPPSIATLLQLLDPHLPMAILITQHMPAMYTQAFADRLKRSCAWPVRIAVPGEAIAQGEVLVAGGTSPLCVVREGSILCVQPAPSPAARSKTGNENPIDRMLISAAQAMKNRTIALLLSGVPGDGVEGTKTVRKEGGHVIAEQPESAIMPGMPAEAIRTGMVHDVLPLRLMNEAITKLVSAQPASR